MNSFWIGLLIGTAVLSLAVVGFLVYVYIRYSPIVARIFEDTPPMHPLRVEPLAEGEEILFRTVDGVALTGTYLDRRTPDRRGVLIFCHEYLSDRWSFQPYIDHLRDEGFDLFTFDFRGHGDSESEAGIQLIQWVADRDLRDLQAAVAYLERRPDHDPRGWGIFGISRGGGAALCLAARDPRIWGVVTDGAFGTRLTMYNYILRWAQIYVGMKWMWQRVPHVVFHFVGWAGRSRSQARLKRRFLDVEDAVARISPRPWLAIHGEKDAYIGPDIARDLHARARDPRELWIVPEAKHNRCREADPEGYRRRLVGFFRLWTPTGTVPGSAGLPRRNATAPEQPVAFDDRLEVVATTPENTPS